MKLFLTLLLLCFYSFSYADRIYIIDGGGYNGAGAELVTAITNNGHTVNLGAGVIPVGFTSTCNDPVNGYDWLCFFGDFDFTPLTAQIKAFIDAGGKVFYQYEVSCCTTSSSSVASILSSVTGLAITPNINDYIAFSGSGIGGWVADNVSCCANFKGDAYKGLDGLPVANQIQATANINGSTPAIATSLNFGFHFATTDFTGAADKGGMVGLGDVNAWYDSGEPFSNGGSTPVNPAIVDYFFPNAASTCYLFPPGCLQVYTPNNGAISGTASNNGPLCAGDQLDLSVVSAAATTFSWTGPNGFVSNLQNPTIPNAQTINEGVYTVTISDGTCSTTLTTTVVLTAGGIPTIDPAGPFCIGAPVVNLTSPTAGGTWSGPGITNANTGLFDPSVAGIGNQVITYTVGSGSCAGSDQITIVVNAGPTVTVNNATICPNQSATLTASGATTYTWSPATGLDVTTGSTVVSTVGTTTTYTVTGTTNGCSGTAQSTVDVGGGFQVTVTATPNPVSTANPVTTLLGSLNISSYVWIFPDGSTSTTPSPTFTYPEGFGNQTITLIATSAQGCIDTATVIVYLEDELVFYIPNTFTPDGDEFNNTFQPVFTSGFDPYSFNMLIFNRWGEIIFESNDADKGWDGTYGGKMVPNGTYTWTLSFKSPKNDKKYEFQGHVNRIN